MNALLHCRYHAHQICAQSEHMSHQCGILQPSTAPYTCEPHAHTCMHMQAYNGTNLFVGDLRAGSVAYLTNRGRIEALQGPKALEVGAYGISNGVLGDRWPKVHTACTATAASPACGVRSDLLEERPHCYRCPHASFLCGVCCPRDVCRNIVQQASCLDALKEENWLLACAQVERGLAQLRAMVQEGGFEGGAVPWEALFRDVLGDRQRCEDESALPDTGLPPELERAMSSIFVEQFSNKARQGFDICQWHMCALDCNCASTPPEQHDAGPTQGNVLSELCHGPAQGSHLLRQWAVVLRQWQSCLNLDTDTDMLKEPGLAFMQGLPYGTRSQAVLAVWRDGRAELRERSRGEAADWKEVQHSFTVEGLQQQQQQQEQQRQQKQQGHCAAAQAVH